MYLIPTEHKYTHPLAESQILSNTGAHLASELFNLVGYSFDDRFVLLYRGSRDGFQAADFHSKCDGFEKTLAIIKSTLGNVFGGYTDLDWRGNNQYYNDPNAFIFSLVNKESKPMISRPTTTNVVNKNPANLITFGYITSNGQNSIFIANNCNSSASNYIRAGGNFPMPSNELYAGSANFIVEEIEVFRKI
jgi:hypothetical protein